MEILTAPIFGSKHLIGLLFVVILLIGLHVLRKRKEVEHKKMILWISIAFIVMEIIKLTIMTVNKGAFPMNQLPLHLCSLCLYVYPILYFTKKDSTLEKFVLPAAFATVLAAAVAALVLPTNIIGNNDHWIPFTDNFYPFLSFVYHGLMVYAALYLLNSGYLKLTFKDIPRAWATTGVLMVVAIIANAVLDKDYMLLRTGNGSPLVFLLDNGQLVYTFSMIGLGLFIIALFILVAMGVQRLTSKNEK